MISQISASNSQNISSHKKTSYEVNFSNSNGHKNITVYIQHVLRKEDTNWVKKCMEYDVEGSRPRGRPKRTWREVVQKDCQARNLNKEDAVDRGRWKKLIKIG